MARYITNMQGKLIAYTATKSRTGNSNLRREGIAGGTAQYQRIAAVDKQATGGNKFTFEAFCHGGAVFFQNKQLNKVAINHFGL